MSKKPAGKQETPADRAKAIMTKTGGTFKKKYIAAMVGLMVYSDKKVESLWENIATGVYEILREFLGDILETDNATPADSLVELCKKATGVTNRPKEYGLDDKQSDKYEQYLLTVGELVIELEGEFDMFIPDDYYLDSEDMCKVSVVELANNIFGTVCGSNVGSVEMPEPQRDYGPIGD